VVARPYLMPTCSHGTARPKPDGRSPTAGPGGCPPAPSHGVGTGWLPSPSRSDPAWPPGQDGQCTLGFQSLNVPRGLERQIQACSS
jgi:hypothetical protein